MDPFFQAYKGGFYGVLRWHQLDELWQQLKQKLDGWFVYDTNQPPPDSPLSKEDLLTFIASTDRYLRKEHEEDYCGIVYINDKTAPSFIKIYDPNNLGVVCGFSEEPPLPRWIVSRIPPSDLALLKTTPSTLPWWKKLLGRT